MVQFDVKRVQKGTESFMVSFDFTKTPVTQIADYIIIAASKYGTSDIHFDPRGEGMMVRFRIDGDCQDYTFIPKAYEKNLTTRLKIMANMNITESRLPQDGAIKGNFGDQYLDMRVSSLPLNEGEKIVIRILDYSRSLDGIDSLGFHPDNLEKIKRMMNLPNGIILTTGATGSGKSTTTYSILQGLNKPETNVITVEDPIEMNIDGINQVQVNSEIGMTFAAALRSILRQDPNVILIGEIRDSETAQIAVRASITGHLVLSTIHTNNALATIERLLDMNVERYLLSTAMAGIISQRLAKMLCPDCHYQRETTKYEKKVFKKYLNKDVAQVWDANPKGCEHCRKGYHGRIAFHEVLEIDETIRAAISNEKLDKKDLGKMVYVGKTITMLQDALYKCLNGETSFEEVYRNIEIENEDDDNYESEMENEIKASAPVDEDEVATSDDLLETPIVQSDVASNSVIPSLDAAPATGDAAIPSLDAAAPATGDTVIPSLDAAAPATGDTAIPSLDAAAPATGDTAIPGLDATPTPTPAAAPSSDVLAIPTVGADTTAGVQDSIPTVLDNSQNADVSVVTPDVATPDLGGIAPVDTVVPSTTPGVTEPVMPTTQDISVPQVPAIGAVDQVGMGGADQAIGVDMSAQAPDGASVLISDSGVVPIAPDSQIPAQFTDLNSPTPDPMGMGASVGAVDVNTQVVAPSVGDVNASIPTVNPAVAYPDPAAQMPGVQPAYDPMAMGGVAPAQQVPGIPTPDTTTAPPATSGNPLIPIL